MGAVRAYERFLTADGFWNYAGTWPVRGQRFGKFDGGGGSVVGEGRVVSR